MKKIELSKQGKHKGKYYALVDDKDFNYLSKFRWNYCKNNKSDVSYATRAISKRKGYKTILMHRIIMKLKKGFFVDHINMNGLDNRRSNLRLATRADNMRNRDKTKANTSGYKGVVWDKWTNKWMAQINYLHKHLNLGRFSSKEKAAQVYNEAIKKYHGKFARLNTIQEKYA